MQRLKWRVAASKVTWNCDQEPTVIDDGVLSPEISEGDLQCFENVIMDNWNILMQIFPSMLFFYMSSSRKPP